jgi:hypothetical protein
VDARTDGSLDILWPSAKAATHLSDAFFHDPLYRSAPARMENTNCPQSRVDKNHG